MLEVIAVRCTRREPQPVAQRHVARDRFQHQFAHGFAIQRPNIFTNLLLVRLALSARLCRLWLIGMERFLAGVLEPRQRDRTFAEDAVASDRAIAFIGQLAVVAHAQLDTVPARAAHIGANDAVTLFQARHDAVVEMGFTSRKCLPASQRPDFAHCNDIVKW